MSKYWENFNMRKLEEWNRRKTEVIDIIPGVIVKRDTDKEVKPKHIYNSYLYNFAKRYLSLNKVNKFTKLICLYKISKFCYRRSIFVINQGPGGPHFDTF